MWQWARWLAVGAAVLLASWAVLVVAARRLPPGLGRDLATVLPACVTTARRLRRDPRVPRRVKVVVAFAGLWVLSPIDLIPEFLPVIGPLDDVVVVALALRYAARRVPPEALVDAWPAEPRLLHRLAPRTAAVGAADLSGDVLAADPADPADSADPAVETPPFGIDRTGAE